VRDACGRLHRLAGAEHALVAADHQLELSAEDLVVLDLPRVDVGLDEEPARAPQHVELDELAVGLLRGAHELHAAAQLRHLQHVSSLRHLRPPGLRP
jgi:hypothetical protein